MLVEFSRQGADGETRLAVGVVAAVVVIAGNRCRSWYEVVRRAPKDGGSRRSYLGRLMNVE